MPRGNLGEFFVRNNHNYSLPSESELLLPNVNSVFKGQNSISYFGSVKWNSIPFELRKASSYQIFKSEIKRWRPTNCPCRLCKNYIGNLGFTNISSWLVRHIYDYMFYLTADFIHCVDSV